MTSMVVTKIDNNARKILEDFRDEMKSIGISSPNLSEVIRYMKQQIVEKRSWRKKDVS